MKRIEVIDKAGVPRGGILKSNEFSSMSTSDDIIRSTQSWAASRRREFEQKLELERQQAITAAYQEGLAGFFEARDQYVQATQKLSQKLEFLLRKSLNRLFGVWMPSGIIEATLAPLLGDLGRQSDVSIQIHPNSAAKIKGFLATHLNDPNLFRIFEDRSLDEAECTIFTQSEIIDMSRTILVDQLMTAMSHYIEIATAAQHEEFGAHGAR